MILVRDIFQVQFGKIKEVINLWKEGLDMEKMVGGGAMRSARILTDLAGPSYYTLVLESTFESLSDFENSFKSAMSSLEMRKWYQNVVPLTVSGYREIFTIVE